MPGTSFSGGGGAATVLRVAVLSRLLTLSLILLSRTLFHPYDTSAALNPPCLSSAEGDPAPAVRWPRLGAAIERSVVWDGVYFVRIAECGYEYEQTFAFMPLLPACIALLSGSVFAPLVSLIGYRAVLALSGYVLNNLAFVLAAVYLYRGVGFLKYFQVKQLPNFFLASPILSLAICSIIQYARFLPQVFQSLVTQDLEKVAGVPYSAGDNSRSRSVDHMVRQRKRENSDVPEFCHYPKPTGQEAPLSANQGYSSIFVLPFVLHLTFMTFTALFVMHVQVATRFLSASPSIYWFTSYVFASLDTTHRRWAYFIWVYFAAYLLLGSLLFSNFYPFT